MTPRPARRASGRKRLRRLVVRVVRAVDGALHAWACGPYESTLAVTALVVLAAASPVFAACALFDWLAGGRVAASGESGADAVPLLVAGTAIALLALGLLRFCRCERRITERQTLTALVLGALAAVAAVAIAHLATGTVEPAALATAFAEAAATITGTNSTAIPEAIAGDGKLDLGGGMLALRAVGQWLGGAAFIVVLVRVLPHLGVGGLDADGGVATRSARRLAARSAGTMGRLLLLYGALTVLVAVGYALAGMPVLQSGLHALTTASTGGFSSYADSLRHFDSAAVEWVAIFGMAAGGVSLPLMFLAIRRRDPARFIRSYEFRLYVTLIVLSTVAVALWTSGDFGSEHVRKSLFAVVSVISTTGFEATPFVAFSTGSQALLMVLMLVGGMSASVAGGFKVVRLLTLVSYIGRELRRAVHPTLAERLHIGRSTITETTMSRIVGELLLAALLVIPAAIVLGASGLGVVEALTYVVSALSNVGPAMSHAEFAMDAVGSIGHLAAVDALGRVTAGLLMLVGRMSVTAAAVALSVVVYPITSAVRHGHWRRRRHPGAAVR
ncbi:TrkH family potassium uptake protein [Candidatus Poriferisodalis sp.]|uniref:TrkH family potassium uptake protein n=1 Tax=Candidatus Poriferisodalis sp. TaxID=3101277 RepID=UPI003B01E238